MHPWSCSVLINAKATAAMLGTQRASASRHAGDAFSLAAHLANVASDAYASRRIDGYSLFT